MVSSFWSTSITDEEVTTTPSQTQRIAIKHSIPKEEVHELAVDIYETEDRVYIVAPLAGVRSTDIEITVNETQASIKGLRQNPFEEHESKLFTSECFWGKFERKFTLPSSVDTRDMTASFRNGILLIEAPRIAPSGVRRVKIN